MARKKGISYVCSNCGAVSAGWSGRCSVCSEWNTLHEQIDTQDVAIKRSGVSLAAEAVDTVLTGPELSRIKTNLEDVDVVLGGGIVPGSVMLIAGEPGIGKSTLLMQLAYNVARSAKVLYVSAEESTQQVAMRARRLGAIHEQLKLTSSTSANDIAATILSGSYDVVVVDSIQTIATEQVTSAAGSVSQITNSTQLLIAAAKSSGTALFVVGHVTKEGSIAGPKVLEHVVDVVLQLEGDRYGGFKVLRGVKNRFGSTSEAAIFEMAEDGLKIVENPSAALLAERQVSDGSIVLATVEGTRPLLVEVQALVNPTSYGYPKRAVSGMDLNRLNLLIAMLERRTKLKLNDKDIYVNIVGGIRLMEPAGDLAIAMAIASATKGMQLKQNAVVFGELGLSGEVRHVPLMEKRIAEAKKLGFELAIGPTVRTGKKPAMLHSVPDVRSALNTFLEKE